jgi:ribosomal protein S1
VGGAVDDPGETGDGLAWVQVGDLRSGIVVAVSRSGGFEVALDGVPGPPSGVIGSQNRDWRWPAAEELKPGDGVTAGVIAIDADQGKVRLSLAAARRPELWAFLSGLIPGQELSGTIAAIKPFGVFVRVAEHVEGLAPLQELDCPVEALPVDSEITVAVAGIDLERRRLVLSQRAACPGR